MRVPACARVRCSKCSTIAIGRFAGTLRQDAAWKIIKQRLDALEQTCVSLGKQENLGALAPLAGKLHSMSQDIGTYIPRTTTRPQRPGKPADHDS